MVGMRVVEVDVKGRLVIVVDFCYCTIFGPEIDAAITVCGVKDPHDPSPACRGSGACGSRFA